MAFAGAGEPVAKQEKGNQQQCDYPQSVVAHGIADCQQHARGHRQRFFHMQKLLHNFGHYGSEQDSDDGDRHAGQQGRVHH